MRYTDFKITEAATSAKLKHGSTRGHMGEYLIGSAVVAKLIKGSENITVDDVKNVMSQTSATDNLSQTFTGQGGDQIEFINIIKNVKNIADAKDVQALSTDMASEMQGAAKFANSDMYAKKWARLIADNGKPDRVVVKAAGEEDQSGTKADIFLIYIQPDGTERTLKGWSLKTGSNMIGQASPRTFENMQVFFKDLGVTLQPIDNYEENPAEHVVSVMQQVSNDLNRYTAGDQADLEFDLVQNITNFMDEHLTKKDPKVYIVNLGKGDYNAQTMRTMRNNLNTVNLETTLNTSGRPSLYVHSIGNVKNFLFMIRYTYSPRRTNSKGKTVPERHKLVVETGPLFKTLGTISNKV